MITTANSVGVALAQALGLPTDRLRELVITIRPKEVSIVAELGVTPQSAATFLAILQVAGLERKTPWCVECGPVPQSGICGACGREVAEP